MTQKRTAKRTNIADLTPRQIAICQLLVAGLSDKQIVDELGIKIDTLRYHLNQLREKTGNKGRVQLAVWYSTARRRETAVESLLDLFQSMAPPRRKKQMLHQ